jgi:transcriptional regulator with XRE-family HTH domain
VEGVLQRTVGENLRAYRKARALSQEAFADVFGWGRTYMGQLERGECNLRLTSLEYIASRVELDAIELLTPESLGKRGAGRRYQPFAGAIVEEAVGRDDRLLHRLRQ